MTEEVTNDAFDFSKVSHEETVQEESVFAAFTETPPEAGPALIRLREVVELGMVQEDYNGKPKKNLTAKMKVVFEIVHAVGGSHAITKEDGSFVRNKDVTLFLNKSFNEKAKYRKLFSKMNYNGAIPTVPGEKPSMHLFLGKGFLVDLAINKSEKNGKTYVNLTNEAGEFTVRQAAVAVTDPATGIPTGEMQDVKVPEMNGDQVCFLWGSKVSDDILKAMWDSTFRDGTYEKDGKEFSLNFTQNDISNPEKNLAWEGSREQALLAGDAIDADLAAGLETQADPLAEAAATTPSPTAETETVPTAETATAPEVAANQAAPVDPLAALGL